MTRALLNPQAADHLAKLCGMFGSDHAGERAAAALKADEHIRRLGLTWRDVIVAPATSWQAMAKRCRENLYLLTERERDFILNIAKLRKPPSDAQLKWLSDIFARIGGDA